MKPIGKKVLFIGDIHGLTEWQELAKDGLKHFYEIVFLGDYVDSFFVKASEQLYNLNTLITFLKRNKDKATALIGNHDYAYIQNYQGISGHQFNYAHEYRKLFQDNIDLFQIAWGYENSTTKKYTLATHAGLTQTFWKRFILIEINDPNSPTYQLIQLTEQEENRKLMMHEKLNLLRDKGDILWKVGSMRGGSGTPGPLWADFRELIEDPFEGINQVVGHTPKVAPSFDHFGDDFIACIDSWGNKRVASMIITL